MIYRVEFNRDGSVSSCKAVERQVRDGKLVLYVDAADSESAITLAQRRFKRWKSKIYDDAKAAGLCLGCLKRRRGKDGGSCRVCNARSRRHKAQLREIELLPEPERPAALAERQERVRVTRLEVARKLGALAVVAAKAKSDAWWDSDAVPVAPNVQAALRQVLRAYDRAPARFRDWLLSKLDSAKGTAAE